MTENPGQWGPQGGSQERLPAAESWRLSASTAGGLSASAAWRLSASAGLSASTAGNRRLSAAGCLCTPATSWWISAAAARGVRTSGPGGWRPWYPRCDRRRRAQ